MSLRARLLLVTLGLLAVALLVTGWATHRALRDFLVDRVDRELADARGDALGLLVDPRGPSFGRPDRIAPSALPAESLVELRDASGTMLRGVRFSADSRRRLPARIPDGYSDLDVRGGGRYRVLSTDGHRGDGLPGDLLDDGRTLVLAIPLSEVEGTLDRLLVIELLVGGVALVILGASALWLVRLGLRPIERIEATAREIAGGDLSRRITDADARTEIGRLGATLNGMLGRIEQAFAERTAGEQRLRRFVADASHELQTPLTSVRGYAELFRRGAAERPEDLRTAMARIESEATRMGLLVDDLLLLARLDQGRPLEDAPVDLTRLVGDLVADARVVEPDRPIALEATADVRVRGDDARLRQVVSNLLANARAHTPAGTPVRVGVGHDDRGVVVEVADSGPGLTPDEAARVFERFFRADPSRARASGGSGLGLSIVAAIAEAHGGSAEVQATPGGGATFRVRLPSARPGADPATHRSL